MSLRAVTIACLAGLAVAACGGSGDRSAMIAAFTEAGMDEATSACMADKAKADMEPELYSAMVEAARRNDDSLDSLTVAQQAQLGQFMFEAALACVKIEIE